MQKARIEQTESTVPAGQIFQHCQSFAAGNDVCDNKGRSWKKSAREDFCSTLSIKSCGFRWKSRSTKPKLQEMHLNNKVMLTYADKMLKDNVQIKFIPEENNTFEYRGN